MEFREVINFFNQKNSELQNKVRNTEEYREYLNCSDLRRRNELVRTINDFQYVEKRKNDKEICDFLIKNTEFKDNSPYICDMCVEVKGQKLFFGGKYSLNGGDVSSMYRDFIREKNKENKKSVVFNVGDIYFGNKNFYRIKKTTDKSVVIEKLKKELIETDFDSEKYREECLKDNHYSLSKGLFYNPSSYYYWKPSYKIICKEKPSTEVEFDLKMTVVFEKGKTILRNKSKGLDISEKWDGKDITSTYDLKDHTPFSEIDETVSEIGKECRKKSDTMTEQYLTSEEGKKEIRILQKKYEEEQKKSKEFNKKYDEIGVSKDPFMTSFDLHQFWSSDNDEKKKECYEELKKSC